VIAFLQGVLAAKTAETVELDVNGVGYELVVSRKTFQTLPGIGQTVLLKTYLHVREDILQLYGFHKDAEKQAFLLLISVSGIGPKAAMNILSSFAPENLYQLILQNDITSLRSAPGVGQKTAQHMVLELKDKVTKLVGSGVFVEDEALGVETKNLSDAIQAMMALGYSPVESRRAVLTAVQSVGTQSTVEELLRFSLKSVARV
jgi:holliday junction DNA helicase RuvA